MSFHYDSPSLQDHPMAIFHAGEVAETASDRAWSRYVDRCAQLLGVKSLDGDEAIEGYSLDTAHDAWRAGISPTDYAAGKRV